MSDLINFEPGKLIKSLPEEGIEVYLSDKGEHVYFLTPVGDSFKFKGGLMFLTPVGDSFKFEGGLMFGVQPWPWVRFTYAKTKTSSHFLMGMIQYTYNEATKEPIEASFVLEKRDLDGPTFRVSLTDIDNPTNGDIKLEGGILLFKQMFKAEVFQQARYCIKFNNPTHIWVSSIIVGQLMDIGYFYYC